MTFFVCYIDICISLRRQQKTLLYTINLSFVSIQFVQSKRYVCGLSNNSFLELNKKESFPLRFNRICTIPLYISNDETAFQQQGISFHFGVSVLVWLRKRMRKRCFSLLLHSIPLQKNQNKISSTKKEISCD